MSCCTCSMILGNQCSIVDHCQSRELTRASSRCIGVCPRRVDPFVEDMPMQENPSEKPDSVPCSGETCF